MKHQMFNQDLWGQVRSWVNACYWYEHGHERTPVPQTHGNSKAFPVFTEASILLLLADHNQGLLPSDTAHLTHLLLVSATVINANLLFPSYWCSSSPESVTSLMPAEDCVFVVSSLLPQLEQSLSEESCSKDVIHLVRKTKHIHFIYINIFVFSK